MTDQNDAITRRAVLGGALGVALMSIPVSMLDAQTPNAPARIHDTFDFGWKFFKGDAPGARSVNHFLPDRIEALQCALGSHKDIGTDLITQRGPVAFQG